MISIKKNLEKLSQAKEGWRYHILSLLLLVALTIPSFADNLRPGYFPMHDDLQAARQLVMDKCFRDGQIPCRWSEDLGFGYGYPLFSYYPPLPYYIGEAFRVFGLQFIDIVKALFVLSFLVSGFGMYLLAQQFWGRVGGLISAVFYIYAPYHAVDVYVRGAMNETWALSFFPWVFWLIYRLITSGNQIYIPALALTSALLMLSHNLMLMIFAPMAVVWALFWVYTERRFRALTALLVSAVWAVGLAAFFTSPVVLEQKYVHVETLVQGYFNYLAHFATLNQLFVSQFWGYGGSTLGPNDGMSFQIGYFHWGAAILSLAVAAKIWGQNRRLSVAIIMLFVLTASYTAMTVPRAVVLWKMLPPLEYLQFPWRFLAFTIFGSSFLAGSLVLLISKSWWSGIKLIFFAVVITGSVFFYKDYFKWEKHWPEMNDQEKFTGELWRLQITAGIFDYLPKWAPKPPGGPPNGDLEIIEGKGTTEKIFKNSIKQEYRVSTLEDVTVRLNTFYFPGWKYYIDGKEMEAESSLDKELGRPELKVLPGEHTLVAKFNETPIRLISNIFSFVAWGLLVVVGIFAIQRTRKFR